MKLLCTRIRQSFIIAVLVLLGTASLTTSANAQCVDNICFLQWEQAGSSDYYLNINWAMTYTGPSCFCWFPDFFQIWMVSTPNVLMEQQTFGHVAVYTGQQSTITPGPDRTHNFYGLFNAQGFPDSDCTILGCGGSANGPSVIMSTDLPYPPTDIMPTYLEDGGIQFDWTPVTDIPVADYSVVVSKNGMPIDTVPGGTTTWSDGCGLSLDLYAFRTKFDGTAASQTYTVTGDSVSYEIPDPRPPPASPPLGRIDGIITTLMGGAPVKGVAVTAELQNPEAITNGNCWPLTYIDTTDDAGEYVISFIYWGSGSDMAEYVLTPSLPPHGFDPGSYNVTLQAGDYIKTRNFTDTTSFAISGTVTDGTCGVEDVQISALGPGSFVPATTNGVGQYTVIVSEAGVYDITATVNGVQLDTSGVDVQDDVIGIDFHYPVTDTLSGFVGAGCNEYIGQATLEVRSVGGCLVKTIVTDGTGYFSDTLPSRPLEVQVVNFVPNDPELDAAVILQAIGSVYSIGLDSATTQNIIYRKPLSFEILGMPGPPCAAMPYPVLNQDRSYQISIRVWESLGVCLADTGFITIIDNIATVSTQSAVLDTVPISGGVAIYTVDPGDPALLNPYLKTLSLTAHVDNNLATTTVEAVVSGSRIRTETVVTAPSDSLPLLLLRDPPGDQSYSFFEQNNTLEYTQSYSYGTGADVNIWLKGKGGYEGFGIKAWGILGGAINVGGSYQSTTEGTVSMTTTNQISTSDGSSFIGPDADLVMGAAINFKYGLADERIFDLNTCSIVKDTALVFSPDTFATTFIHTVSFIKANIIPVLEILAANPDTTEEVRRKFRNKIRVWEQILQLNDDLKEQALQTPVDNYTIDAGATLTSSITGRSTRSSSYEFTTFLNAQILTEVGVEFFGSGGSFGVEVNIRSNFGGSESNTQTEQTTTGFHFEDGEIGDFVSFDYAIDSVYGTPVFGNILGATSCPHEEGTAFINLPTFVITDPVKFVEVGNTVFYDFTVINSSEFGPGPNTYIVDFVEQSNEFGATVLVNGSDEVEFTIPIGGQANGIIQVTRAEGSPQFAFEGLQFDCYPACIANGVPMPDQSVNKTGYISAYFANDCSDVTLSSPAENWVINQSSSDQIMVTMDGYDLSDDAIDHIKLLYAKNGSTNWLTSNINIPGGNLLTPPQTYAWDVSNLQDGIYVIRWELACGETKNYSLRRSGVIDRVAPQVFGNEKPYDDLYFPGDEISVRFKEDINFNAMHNGNVFLKMVPQGTIIPALLQGQKKEIIVVPDGEISGMYNQGFEVCVTEVQGLYGNVRPDTVTWRFVVSEPDSDQDGVPDTKDRCPGGDDFVDTDMGGLPDDCDCSPNNAFNDRILLKNLDNVQMDFDGTDDHFTVPNAQVFNPDDSTSITIEAWIMPDLVSDTNCIVSKGDGYTGSGTNGYKFSTISNEFGLYMDGVGGGSQWFMADSILTADVWTHVAVSYNSADSILKFFYNGALAGVDTVPFIPYNGDTNPLYIGRQGSSCNCNFFKGQMDEIRIWSEARMASQVNGFMDQELKGFEQNLIAYYDFNQGIPDGGNTGLTILEDQSPAGRDATPFGFTQNGSTSNWVKGEVSLISIQIDTLDLCTSCPGIDTVNAGMNLDGVDDAMTLDTSFADLSDNFTYEFWVNPQDTVPDDVLEMQVGVVPFFLAPLPYVVVPNPGHVLYGLGHSVVGVAVGTNGVQVFEHSASHFPAVLVHYTPIDGWTHVAVVYENKTPKLYLNGEYIKTGIISVIDVHPSSGVGGFFEGDMDDVRYWDHVRTPGQIFADLQQELVGDEPGLELYYNFNNGLPEGDNAGLTIVPDLTGNGHDATVYGFTQTGNSSNWITSPFSFGDGDKDGLPDLCDDCFAVKSLLLENMVLDGTFRGRETIILGAGITFGVNAEVLLRAPAVKVIEPVIPSVGVTVNVTPEPCEE